MSVFGLIDRLWATGGQVALDGDLRLEAHPPATYLLISSRALLVIPDTEQTSLQAAGFHLERTGANSARIVDLGVASCLGGEHRASLSPAARAALRSYEGQA